MKKEHEPFTYYIAWTKENLYYYGVRYSKGCSPEDLWTTYFTSSPGVDRLRETIGEPNIVEVRKVFKTFEKARDWETKVLRRLKVTQRDDWINECSWPAIDNRGRTHSEETKKKMSESRKREKHYAYGKRGEGTSFYGKKHSSDTKKKMSKAKKGNRGEDTPMYGKTHSKETKKRMSEAQKGKNNPMYGKRGKDCPNFGRKHSEGTRRKMSVARKLYYKNKKGSSK